MFVGEVCNREVVILRKDESILDAVKLMRENHVGSVVVTEEAGGQCNPVGILTDRDIVVEVLAEGVKLGEVNVGDVMSYELTTIGENADVKDAIELMRSKGVRRIPVVNDTGALVGIMAVDDVVEFIAEELSDLANIITLEQGKERIYRS